jgi:oligopeptide/dipeptide ABC transporter ATP-binding protein
MASLLEVEDLIVRFHISGIIPRLWGQRHVEAVAGVSLTLEQGTTLGLVGESGSGKTTFARAVMGLVPVHAGRVRFNGRELSQATGRSSRRAWCREMAFVFQDPVGSLSPRLSVQKLVTEPFVIHGLSRRDLDAEARRLLGLVGLSTDFAGRYPHELSGGQARRVNLARALALSPKLLIADEPTAGLDVSVQGEILNLLNRLQDELGLTYLVITHNLAVVRHVCDRVAVMYLGRLIEQGKAERLFRAPAHPYTRGLILSQPNPNPRRRRPVEVLQGEVPSLRRRPAGCEFHTRCQRQASDCLTGLPAMRELDSGHEVRCLFPHVEQAVERIPTEAET